MTGFMETSPVPAPTPPGLRYGRIAGRAVGVLLLAIGVVELLEGAMGFGRFQAAFCIAYGALLNLPFQRFRDRVWKAAFGGLILFSVAFVFIMIASVMFDYMAAAERGQRLGVPGFEGTLIFLSLLQVPVVLFLRRPDLLD